MKKFLYALSYAYNGVRYLAKGQSNFRIHICIMMIVIITGCITGLSYLEWIAVIGCIGLVLTTEAINTCIEELCNFISPQRDPRIGKIKDIAAAAVLITAVVAIVVGLLIFVPKILG